MRSGSRKLAKDCLILPRRPGPAGPVQQALKIDAAPSTVPAGPFPAPCLSA